MTIYYIKDEDIMPHPCESCGSDTKWGLDINPNNHMALCPACALVLMNTLSTNIFKTYKVDEQTQKRFDQGDI